MIYGDFNSVRYHILKMYGVKGHGKKMPYFFIQFHLTPTMYKPLSYNDAFKQGNQLQVYLNAPEWCSC